jgi:hypothetical protein
MSPFRFAEVALLELRINGMKIGEEFALFADRAGVPGANVAWDQRLADAHRFLEIVLGPPSILAVLKKFKYFRTQK